MRSQALFRLLLLPPALDRSCDLLVSSAIVVKPCPRKRFALARCHFADFSSPGFSGSSSVDIGCPLEEVAQELACRVGMKLPGDVLEGDAVPRLRQFTSKSCPLSSLRGERGKPRQAGRADWPTKELQEL